MKNEFEHRAAMYTACRRVIPDMNRIGCIGGRMFWQRAESNAAALGYVGTCCFCGAQDFTGDLIHRSDPTDREFHKWGDGRHATDRRRVKLARAS